MATRGLALWVINNVCAWSFSCVIVAAFSCTQKEAPKLEPAAPPPQPRPAPIVRDAAPDAVVDAAADGGDAHGPGKKRATTAPASGGGLKVEGTLPRAEGEKV